MVTDEQVRLMKMLPHDVKAGLQGRCLGQARTLK